MQKQLWKKPRGRVECLPQVRSSSKESKVSFLEKKGLTSAEIDEAFKRVPDNMAGD